METTLHFFIQPTLANFPVIQGGADSQGHGVFVLRYGSHNHSCTVAQFLGPGRHPVLFYQEQAFRSNPHYHVVYLAASFEPFHRGFYLLPSGQVTLDFVIRYFRSILGQLVIAIIGDQEKAQAMLEHFGSLDLLSRASVDQLKPFVSRAKGSPPI